MKPEVVFRGTESRCHSEDRCYRNMSAPPRTSLNVRPYKPVLASGNKADDWGAAGMTFSVSLSRDHILRMYVPEYLRPGRHCSRGRKRVLAGLLVLSRMASKGNPARQV